MKGHSFFLFVLLVMISSHSIFSQDEGWDVHVPRGAGDNIKYGLIAAAETQLFIWPISVFNYFLLDFSWALPTTDSIRNNFITPWGWEDTDDFAVNQIGHPIHGLVYYGAGRVNGFSYYQSVFFSAFAGFVWETFGEANHGSINDLITTTTSSLAVGEMFYRLYVEAYAWGIPAPLAFIVNPMAGIHRLLTGWVQPDAGRNLYQLRLHAGGGYAVTHYYVSGFEQEVFSFQGPFAEIGANVVYGNPFEQDTHIPYRHFELAVSYGLNPDNYNHLRIISDGYLFSFSPQFTHTNTQTDTMSTGLSMHFDFQAHGKPGMEDSTVDQYSNALDWTIKYQHLYQQDTESQTAPQSALQTALQLKLHAGLTFFGASKYFAGETVINDFGHEKTDYNNFGGGLNAKFYSSIENKWGRLEMSMLYYVIWTYPGATHFSKGNVWWLFTDLGYFHRITKHFSLGFTYSYVMERGSFSDRFLDIHKSNEMAKIFVECNL